MYKALTGDYPFNGIDFDELIYTIRKIEPKMDINLSNEAKDFLSKLMHKNSKERLSAWEALYHPWF